MTWFQQSLHAADHNGDIGVLNHREDADEEKEENIEELK